MTGAHGRTLPPPAKPKRKGHEPPAAAELPASNGAAPALARPHEAELAPELPPAVTTEEAREPVRAASGSPEAPGSRTTVYSDTGIEDFLQEVKIHAAMARLDLTASAVWRRAMHDLMQRITPAQLVHEFDAVPVLTEEPRPGRPRR